MTITGPQIEKNYGTWTTEPTIAYRYVTAHEFRKTILSTKQTHASTNEMNTDYQPLHGGYEF
jgi:hypothetical protein